MLAERWAVSGSIAELPSWRRSRSVIMLHDLQPLLALAHRLVESAGGLLSITMQTTINAVDEQASRASPLDSLIERLPWAPVSAAMLAVVSFAGFLLLVRYLNAANRQPKQTLPTMDIFVSIATALIGLAVCWATG